MPITTIQVPDGTVVKIQHPEGASEDNIKAYAKRQYEMTHSPADKYIQETLGANPVEAAVKGAGVIGHGVINAGAGLVNAVMDATRGLMNAGTGLAYEGTNKEPPLAPRPSWQGQVDAAVTNPHMVYQPEGPVGKGASRVVEGMASMLPTNRAQAILGGLSGAGSTLAESLFPGVPGASTAGGIAPFVPGAAVAFRTPNLVKSLQSALKEDPELLSKAFADRAKTGLAVPLPGGGPTSVLNELAAANPNHPLIGAARVVAASPEGTALREQLKAEAAAAKAAQEAQLAGATPLTAAKGQQVLETAKQAAEGLPTAQISAATKRIYEDLAAKDIIPSESLAGLVGALQSKGGLYVGTPLQAPYNKAVSGISGSILANEANGVLGMPAKTLDEFGRSFTQPPGGNPTPHELEVGTLINDWGKGSSIPLAAGKMVHATGREWIAKPAAEIMGGLTGSMPAATAALGQKAASDIPNIANAMYNAGMSGVSGTAPDAFSALVGARELGATAGAPSNGAWAADVAGKLNAPKGTVDAAKRESFIEQRRQVGLQAGLSPEDADMAAQGAANTMDALQKMDAGQAAISGPPSTEAFKKHAEESSISGILRAVTPSMEALRTWTLANAVDRAVRARTYGKINDVLSSPDGLSVLKDVANYSPMQNAEEILSRVIGSQAVQQNAPTGGP